LNAEKQEIFAVEHADPNYDVTFLVTRFTDHELTPKFEVAYLEGNYRDYDEFKDGLNINNGSKAGGIFCLYGAGLRELIEKLEEIEK